MNMLNMIFVMALLPEWLSTDSAQVWLHIIVYHHMVICIPFFQKCFITVFTFKMLFFPLSFSVQFLLFGQLCSNLCLGVIFIHIELRLCYIKTYVGIFVNFEFKNFCFRNVISGLCFIVDQYLLNYWLTVIIINYIR